MWHVIFLALVSTSYAFINPYPKGVEHKFEGDGAGKTLLLTPYLKQGKAAEARELSLVTGLTPNLTSYAGFLTVDEECDSNLFFWFFPSQNNPQDDPVSVWLQGGPGTTSFFGILNENGPYNLRLDGELDLREYSWTRNSSVIYIDNPVGTGYSYTGHLSCYASNQAQIGQNLLVGLEQFFELFPELKSNSLFVTGESYAGKYVPAAAYAIHTSNSDLNLQGILIGNGLVDPRNQQLHAEFLYQVGLIDAELRDQIEDVEEAARQAIDEGDFVNGFLYIGEVLIAALDNMEFTSIYNFLYADGKPLPDIDSFVNQQQVRQALHVGNATWNDGSLVYTYLENDIPQSVKPWLQELMENYRVTLYNGQLDIIVAYPLTIGYVETLQWSGREEYLAAERRIWSVGSDIAGYAKSGGNFTEVLVRNAGHMVPIDQPEWAFDIYNKFVLNETLAH